MLITFAGQSVTNFMTCKELKNSWHYKGEFSMKCFDNVDVLQEDM